tara:strand:- start:40 stop:465 length:426 start_codon:yes stop_codon:yes gene_type:complete
MASELKVDKFTGVTTAGSILVTGEGNSTTTNLQQGLCKVWYNISSNFSTTNDSFNITSITDNATGEHNGNFTNNMTGASYGALADHHNNNNSGAGLRMGQVHDTASDGVRVHTGVNSGSNINFEEDGNFTEPVCHVMGDLA